MAKTILIKPRVLHSGLSYWAMFYCSILKAITYQKNIDYRLVSQSLQNYRGTLAFPSNFFNKMKASVRNHGFEYLMIDYLRSKDGADVRKILTDSLLRQYGISDFEITHLNIFKLGEESVLYEEISKYNDPDVKIITPAAQQIFKRAGRNQLQGQTRPVSKVAETFLHSDLLLMVSDGRNHTYGFIGEVEGGHGENLFRGSYFNNNNGIKGKYTTFALGASERKAPIDGVAVKENVVLTQDSEGRLILHFSNSNEFIKSFKHAINNMELCFDGHFSNIDGLDFNHEEVIKIISNNWNGSVHELIFQLENHIEYDMDVREYMYQTEDENGEFIYKPSPIALGSQFYLHKINKLEKI